MDGLVHAVGGKRALPQTKLALKKVGLTRRQAERLAFRQATLGRSHRGGEAQTLREAIDAGLDALGVPKLIEELSHATPSTPGPTPNTRAAA